MTLKEKTEAHRSLFLSRSATTPLLQYGAPFFPVSGRAGRGARVRFCCTRNGHTLAETSSPFHAEFRPDGRGGHNPASIGLCAYLSNSFLNLSVSAPFTLVFVRCAQGTGSSLSRPVSAASPGYVAPAGDEGAVMVVLPRTAKKGPIHPSAKTAKGLP
jgi:hypothetical protein